MADSPASSPSPPMHESHLRGLERLPPGQGARHLCRRRPSHADRDHGPAERLRRPCCPTPIPGKGQVLTTISKFWFDRTRHIVPNHLARLRSRAPCRMPRSARLIEDRAMVVHRLRALPVEAVVRGYLIGSGWEGLPRYRPRLRHPTCLGTAHGRTAGRGPIFTPSTKAERAGTTRTCRSAAVEAAVGAALAAQVRDTAVALYEYAAAYALERRHHHRRTPSSSSAWTRRSPRPDREALTPDSSASGPVDTYARGRARRPSTSSS